MAKTFDEMFAGSEVYGPGYLASKQEAYYKVGADFTTGPGRPLIPGGSGDIYGYYVDISKRLTGNFSTAVGVDTLNKKQKKNSETQATVAGANSVLPIIYGARRCGAKIGAMLVYNDKLVILAAWCLGEVSSVGAFAINDDLNDIAATSYVGTQTQTPDPTLVAAYAAQGIAYNDALPGVCYSVFQITASRSASFPRLSALVNGMKVRTTQGGARTYSDNPAYAIADFIESTDYGMARTVDWASVAATAAACDALVGGEKKRVFGLSLDTPQPGETWLQVLRDYAGCWIVPDGAGGSYRLIPDVPGASVYSFGAGNIVEGSLKLEKRGSANTPTAFEITYTKTAKVPWADDTVTVYAPGVLAGTVPRRMSKIQKPGIFRKSEANRYAIERLNDATLNDLNVTFATFDEGLRIQVGDIIDVTHPIGLSAKLFRVLRAEPSGGGGRWSIAAQEYDAAKYSSVVVTDPSTPDTTLPDPFHPPIPTGLVVSEDIYQSETGIWASRIRATWDAGTYPYVAGYVVNVTQSGVVKETATVTGATTYLTKPLTESLNYSVSIGVLSTFGVSGTPATASLTTIGKTAIPGDVPTIRGFEAGGRVFLYWTPAIDLDIWRYEIRYGATTGNWNTAQVIDVVDALAYEAPGIPAGPWRFYIKAIDSVRQYSVNARTLDLTVTLDSSAFVLGAKNLDDLGPPTLTSMTAYYLRGGDSKTYYVSDFGDANNYGYTNTDDTTGTFADDARATMEFARPHSAGTSGYLSEYVTAPWDIGQTLTGNFTGTITYSALAGSAANAFIETSLDGSAWTQAAGLSAKITARFARIRVTSSPGLGIILVESGATIRIDAYPRTETGVVITNASGRTIVNLSYKYAAAKTIALTPKGTVARTAVYDNILLSPTGANTFDIYLFSSNGGNQLSGEVSWSFQGV